jgi:hypothetical protein
VRGFGAALAWAIRRHVDSLDVLVDDGSGGAPGGSLAAGVIARRAREMALPPGIWEVRGRQLVAAAPAPAGPPRESLDDSSPKELWELIRAHGAEPVLEHGVLRGEYLGLEVARVVSGQLEVGVGRQDRAGRIYMRPGESPGDALDEVVAAVKVRRHPGAALHPANTLARGRWLRSVVCSRPDIVGAVSLVPVSPPVPWFDLPEAGPAPCLGRSASSGAPLMAVCSVGIDLDLVPTAGDARLTHCPEAELVLVVPEGDNVPLLGEMAALLARPANIHTVPKGWQSLVPQ